MKSATKLSGFFKKYDHIIAAIAAYYAVYLFTHYSGIGISPDSVMYASTARNVVGHGTFSSFNGKPLVDFPVFYPAFLSVILKACGVDMIKAAPVLNGMLFALVIWITGWITLRLKNASWLYKWLIVLLVLLSPTLLQVYTYLWSETLFILLTLVFFIALRNYQRNRTLPNLITVAAIAAIATITRYAGITLIATDGFLILADLSLPLRRKIIYLLIYAPVSFSLLAGNILRNRIVTGTATGPREPSITPFSQNLNYFGSTLLGWVNVDNAATWLCISIAAIVLLAFAVVILINILRRRVNSYEMIVLTFAFIYGAFIVLSSTFSRYERINNRLLSPMYIPFFWACTSYIALWLKTRRFNINVAKTAGLTLVILLICFGLWKTDKQRYDDEGDYGVPGFTDDDWNKSAFVKFLHSHPNIYKNGYPIYTDGSEAVYFFSGRAATLLPHRFFPQKVAAFYRLKRFYLVWINVLDNAELINLKDIQKVKPLKKLYDFPEGAIYLYDDSDAKQE